jgi:hypothetical protein
MESEFSAEIEGIHATGNNLIVNVKNIGTRRITRESITSILPHPGGTVQAEQSVLINPGETKTLVFTWVGGNFLETSYMIVLQVSDNGNIFSLPFAVQTQ